MPTTNCKTFKGKIENYLVSGQNNSDSKTTNVFHSLKLKTWLCRTNIVKKDGYHASHVLFVLVLLPLLRIKTVKGFCEKYWEQWSKSKKDTFYRFKQNASYRWRSFMYKVNVHIFKTVELDKTPQEERYFVIDDTILQKLGRKIENVSFLYDHNLGRSVLGFCIVTLGLFTANGFYPIDFAYRFGKKRHPKSRRDGGRWHIVTLSSLLLSLIQLRPLGYIIVAGQLAVITLTYVWSKT